MGSDVDIEHERGALLDARQAVQDKLTTLGGIKVAGADALADEYISAVVAGTVEKLQQELVVFGRIDDDHVWRVGLYGIDRGGEQLVIDWRAPFAGGFYQAGFADPLGLDRRVSYVGCIDDLFVEDFTSGSVSGSSPLLAELSRSRGDAMRTAVATLQADQDRLVRLDPEARLVLRGGPGTGKTVVGLHRAAWLVYNDQRVTADRILVIGPSDKFLTFVSAVLPTLGEARIKQTTFERLLGPTAPPRVDDTAWIDLLDRMEENLYQPGPVPLGPVRTMPKADVVELMDRLRSRTLAWKDRRRIFVTTIASRYDLPAAQVSQAASSVWPTCTPRQASARLRNRTALRALGADATFIADWLADPVDGALDDEVRARFDGVPSRYSHVIVDEAQDLSFLQLRAVMRRAAGVTLVGDDAQRSNPNGIGLRAAAARLGVALEQMDTAYRMSAEIAEWLNAHAHRHGMDVVELVGIRPTGVAVATAEHVGKAATGLRDRWPNVAVISAADVWSHKGVEYDAVVVDRTGMDPKAVYLAASRAAHELVLVG